MNYLATIAFLLITLLSFGQKEPSSNNEVWTGVSLKKELSKKWGLNFNQQFRNDFALSENRSAFLEAGLKYKFHKHYSAKFQYRYIFRNYERNARRMTLDLGAKWKIKPAHLTIKYRARFQNNIVVYTGQNITQFRNKLALEHKHAERWSSFIAYENFYRFNKKNEIRVHRIRGGVDFKASKHLGIRAFYQRDNEVNTKSPVDLNVIGLLLMWKFK